MRVVYECALPASASIGAVVHFTSLSAQLARRVPVHVLVPSHADDTGNWGFSEDVAVSLLRVPQRSVLSLLLYEIRKIVWLVGDRRSGNGRPRQEAAVYLSRAGSIGVASIFARILGYHVVIEVNGWLPDEMHDRGQHWLVCRIVQFTTHLQLAAAHKAIAVTAGLMTRMPTGNRPVLLLPNGVDSSLYASADAVEQGPAPPGRTSVVFAGALLPWQDLETAIRAIQQNAPASWDLTIIGAGPGEGALRELAERLGVAGRIDWIDWVPREVLALALPTHTIGLVPLRPKGHSELCGSPLKLFEYLAAGLHVVAAGVDGVRELEDSLPIITYHVGDPASLNQAIETAAQRPPLRGEQLERIREDIDWSTRCDELLRFVGVESIPSGCSEPK